MKVPSDSGKSLSQQYVSQSYIIERLESEKYELRLWNQDTSDWEHFYFSTFSEAVEKAGKDKILRKDITPQRPADSTAH